MLTEVRSNSPEETFKTGAGIGKNLRGREIILLSGELGAGKTLFTKGIAAAVDVDPDEVVSPTFTIMNRYEGKFVIFHIDLYRLGENLKRITNYLPEIDDNIDEGVIIIEWAQFLPDIYFNQANTIQVEFRIGENNSRLLIISQKEK